MSKFVDIKYERLDDVALITIDRPESGNIFSPHLESELLQALDDANSNTEVRAIIVTGAGRVFSSSSLDQDVDETSPWWASYSAFADLEHTLRKPLLVAVNGFCGGNGFTLALVATRLYAVEEAVFSSSPEDGPWYDARYVAGNRIVPRDLLVSTCLDDIRSDPSLFNAFTDPKILKERGENAVAEIKKIRRWVEEESERMNLSG